MCSLCTMLKSLLQTSFDAKLCLNLAAKTWLTFVRANDGASKHLVFDLKFQRDAAHGMQFAMYYVESQLLGGQCVPAICSFVPSVFTC